MVLKAWILPLMSWMRLLLQGAIVIVGVELVV